MRELCEVDERGAALLTVLLLVAILSVIAAVALERLTLASRMTRNIVSADQGRAYLLAAEQIAAQRLGDLIQQRPDRTTLAGGWLGTRQTMSVPGGMVTVQVRDAGNCFNLNSLVKAGEESSGKSAGNLVTRPEGVEQFSGLMRLLGIDRRLADQVAISAADWIDSDNVPGNGGAEDEFYLRFKPAYRTANGLMADPSELRMVNAVTPELYQRIRPWLCALPEAVLSPLNVNTLLPDQAVLLAMLSPEKLGIDRSRQLLAQRPLDGYGSLVTLFAQGPLAQAGLAEAVKEQVQQKSRWFEVDFSADLGGDKVEETVLYDAKQPPPRLVRRTWGRDGD
jgi:general secretion pathway protein K